MNVGAGCVTLTMLENDTLLCRAFVSMENIFSVESVEINKPSVTLLTLCVSQLSGEKQGGIFPRVTGAAHLVRWRKWPLRCVSLQFQSLPFVTMETKEGYHRLCTPTIITKGICTNKQTERERDSHTLKGANSLFVNFVAGLKTQFAHVAPGQLLALFCQIFK